MSPLYIFDLDGTLALCDHRTPILADKHDPQRWRRFYAACDRDRPNAPVIATMHRLRLAGAEIRIFSGRSDEVRDKTVEWLAEHTPFMSWDCDAWLTMRKAGDYTPDDELKASWLADLPNEDRSRLVAVFDDRARVVSMWRRMGVTCFQVAAGEF